MGIRAIVVLAVLGASCAGDQGEAQRGATPSATNAGESSRARSSAASSSEQRSAPSEASEVVHLSFDRAPRLANNTRLVLPEIAESKSGDAVTRVHGAIERGVRFDGSGKAILVEGIGKQGFGDSLSLEFFARPEGDNPKRRSASYTLAACSTVAHVNYNASREYYTAKVVTDRGQVRLRSKPGQAKLGRWQHVALVYDGAHAKLYVDAQEAASAALTGELAFEDRHHLKLGTWYKTNQAYFGAIDELRLLKRALEPNELERRAAVQAAAAGR